MFKVKQGIKYFLIPTAALLVAFIVINISDVPLKPEAQSLINKKYPQAPTKYIEAYKYALGFRALKDQDPMKIGTEYHNKLKSNQNKNIKELFDNLNKESRDRIKFGVNILPCEKAICLLDEITERKEELKNNREKVELLKSRYRDLIKLGGLAVDLEPGLLSLEFNSIDFLKAHRLVELELSKKFSKGKKKKSWMSL